MNGNLEADSLVPGLDGEPPLRRIRAALAEHRRRLEEGERAYRRWQAQWWSRERVIEQQIRRVQLQLEGLPRLVQPPRTTMHRLRAGKPRATVTACTRQATGRPVT